MKRTFMTMMATGLLLLGVSGCSTHLIDFTMISTKNMDLTKAVNFQRGKERVEEVDEASIIIFIPAGTPSLKEAIDRAIESIPGAVALVDGVITAKSWYIPYIFGKNSFVVEGTPLIDPSLVSVEGQSDYIVSKVDEEGEVEAIQYISKGEYEDLKKKLNL